MQKIFVYQIVDDVSEGILHTFMAPNDILAIRMFSKFINDPKFKGRIVPFDFSLVKSHDCIEVFEAYSEIPDIGSDSDVTIAFGGDVIEDALNNEEAFKHES